MAGAAKFRKAALGFRTHSGWASAILLAGRGDAIAIVERHHISLCDSAMEGAKQPFHAAESMPFAQAESHIARCRVASEKRAEAAIAAMLAICENREARLSGICIIAAAGRALPGLAAILASHALIHTAEGEFYRDAIQAAAKTLGIKTTRLKAADALSRAALQMDRSEGAITKTLAEMGKTVGSPWTSDEKLATLAAWSLLAD